MRKHRGFPVLPTLLVAVAVPTLCGFGTWQLQRSHWKADLLDQYAANVSAPLLDIGTDPIPQNAQFRRVRAQVECAQGQTRQRIGRNLSAETGYSHLAKCRIGNSPITLDSGWSKRPDAQPIAALSQQISGRLVSDVEGNWILVSEQKIGNLEPSAPPSLETISNNHMSYAIQWFSFAGILAIIYAIWLRRWLAQPSRDA